MRKTFAFFILIFAFGLLFFPLQAGAQVGITAVPFLEFNIHARSLSLGGSTVALQHQAAGAHVNPATIGNPGHLELTTQFYDNPNKGHFPYVSLGTSWMPNFNTKLGHYMPALSFSRDQWSFSYQLSYLDLGKQTRRSPSGEIVETFNSYEMAHTLTAAYRWSDYLSFGVGGNFIRSKLVPSGIVVGGQQSQIGTSVSLDLGVYGQYPYQINEDLVITPSAGWSLTDFGSMIKYSDQVEPDPLPMKMRVGLGLKIEYGEPLEDRKLLAGKTPVSAAYYQSFEKLMARRDTLGHSMGPFEALFNSWDTFHRHAGFSVVTYPLGEQIDLRGGLEIIFFEMVSIRQGYLHNAEVNGGDRVSYFGLGFQYDMFKFDYVSQESENGDSYSLSEREFWQFTVSLSTEKIEKWFRAL